MAWSGRFRNCRRSFVGELADDGLEVRHCAVKPLRDAVQTILDVPIRTHVTIHACPYLLFEGPKGKRSTLGTQGHCECTPRVRRGVLIEF